MILRDLIGLEDQGGDEFFGEPEFETADLLRTGADGRGMITVDRAGRRAGPAAAVQHLPDVAARRPVPRAARGRRPRQAQAGVLLRRGAPAVRRRQQGVPRRGHPDRAADPVEGRRRLLRHPEPAPTSPTRCWASWATGCSTRCGRSPRTTPTALAKAVKTYPKTDDYDLADALQQLGTGEAIVTVLSETGAPTPVAWTRLRPPRSLMGQIDPAAQQQARRRRRRCRPSTARRSTAIGLRAAAGQTGPAARGAAGRAAGCSAGRAPKATTTTPARQSRRAGGALAGILGSTVFKSFARSAAARSAARSPATCSARPQRR